MPCAVGCRVRLPLYEHKARPSLQKSEAFPSTKGSSNTWRAKTASHSATLWRAGPATQPPLPAVFKSWQLANADLLQRIYLGAKHRFGEGEGIPGSGAQMNQRRKCPEKLHHHFFWSSSRWLFCGWREAIGLPLHGTYLFYITSTI